MADARWRLNNFNETDSGGGGSNTDTKMEMEILVDGTRRRRDHSHRRASLFYSCAIWRRQFAIASTKASQIICIEDL